MNPTAMTLVLLVNLAIFAYSARRRTRQLLVGTHDRDFSLSGGELWSRIKDVAVYAFGQRRMPYYRAAGIAHMAIFAGFLVLLLRSIMLWARGYDADFDFWGVLGRGTLLGDGYALAKDVFAILVLAGVSVFVWLRVVTRSKRMTLGWEGLMILGIIATMMVTDILYDGAWILRETRIHGEELAFLPFEPAGSVVAFSLQGASDQALLWLGHFGFWTHSTLVLAFLNILPYSKHFHIITAIPNVFTRYRKPAGRLPPVDDLEGRVEREESVGINKVTDLHWNHILDLYTCTECGRCSDNCPAYVTGKKLSPKHLTLALRDHLYEAEEDLLGGTDGVGKPLVGGLEGIAADDPDAEMPKEELHTYPPAPAEGYFRSDTVVEIVPNLMDPDVLWACTSCRACEEFCPVMISYVDKIVGMRRELVMNKGEFPPDLQRAFNGIETNGNPWNQSSMDRADWTEGLDVPLLSDKPDAEVLYWVGCAASFDDRGKRIAQATARLLKAAEVDFAILGTEETCTGDPARRAGNEYLFQIMAEQNVETLNGYEVGKKVIVTTCPHCFNTLANEYPDFGGKFKVVHHADFLMGLVARKKLDPNQAVAGKVVFHDSCYLGRYNDIYASPRQVLESVPDLELVEVDYWNKNRGLCCGAGGAQVFMEERPGTERVNNKRTLQLVDTGATTVAAACPFCAYMLTDGLKSADKEEDVEILDIAEVLAASCGLQPGQAKPAPGEAAEAAE